MIYSKTPFTLDPTNDIDPAAPRSMGMDDTAAAAVLDAHEDLRSEAWHLHADVVDRTATINISNTPIDTDGYLDFGDGNLATWEHLPEGESPSFDHTYALDGVYTVSAKTTSGPVDACSMDLFINWPPPFPDSPPPEAT